MNIGNLIPLDLKLFDAAPASAPAGGDPAPDAAPRRRKNVLAPRGKAADPAPAPVPAPESTPDPALEPTQQLEQQPATVVQTDQDVTPDPDAEFDALVNGQYKDQYTKKLQQIIDARFKKAKEAEQRLSSADEILQALAAKHGVDAKDVDALKKAIDEDDSYWEEEAMKRGMTVQQYKEYRKTEQENAKLKEQLEAQQREQHFAELFKQAAACGVDLNAELNHPETGKRFAWMVMSGTVDVKTAYNAVHHDEIMSGALKQAVTMTAKNVTDNIRTRGMRPTEAAASSDAPVQMPTLDFSRMTREQREQWKREQMKLQARGIIQRF